MNSRVGFWRFQAAHPPFAWTLFVLTTLSIPFSGCGGGSTKQPPLQPPANLQYSQQTISAVQGTAISPDTPEITGTVTSYGVSPTLPAGLALNATTGVISGTPTAVSAAASYTVTASNSAGSTTATVKISVAAAAPSTLAYPQTTIDATVGTAIATDTPTVTGTITAFSVNPTLPAGLTLDSGTGAVSGTPTTGSPQTTYTVTASNVTGSTTAQLTITVTQTSAVLLELGHGTVLAGLHTVGNRVLSEDATGHWNLWDYVTGKIISSGDGALVQTNGSPNAPPYVGYIDLEGQVAAVQSSSGINLLSAVDGTGLGSVPAATWWKLATDGSYICSGSTTALTVYSTAGQTIVTHSGDYHSAVAFAAPGQVQIAKGPKGVNVVETLAVPSGNSTVSTTFNGTFSSWFLDGGHFLTTVGSTVYTYSSSGTQQSVLSLSGFNQFTGQGNWVTASASFELQIYPIGSSTPTLDLNFTNDQYDGEYFPSGMQIAFPTGSGLTGVSIIDLSGASPVVKQHTALGVAIGKTFASASSSQWLMDTGYGAIVDGATAGNAQIRTLGYGQIQSIAATSNLVALAASNGQILVMNPSGPTIQSTIQSQVSKVELSADGSILGAGGAGTLWPINPKLSFYSIPSLSAVSTFAYAADFNLSGSGKEIATGGDQWTSGSTQAVLQAQVMDISGTPVIWSENNLAQEVPPPRSVAGWGLLLSGGAAGQWNPTHVEFLSRERSCGGGSGIRRRLD